MTRGLVGRTKCIFACVTNSRTIFALKIQNGVASSGKTPVRKSTESHPVICTHPINQNPESSCSHTHAVAHAPRRGNETTKPIATKASHNQGFQQKKIVFHKKKECINVTHRHFHPSLHYDSTFFLFPSGNRKTVATVNAKKVLVWLCWIRRTLFVSCVLFRGTLS